MRAIQPQAPELELQVFARVAWKAWERRLSTIFGGRRRGPDTRGSDGGKNDMIHDFWSLEAKLLGRPSFCDLLGAAKQAEDNADPHHCPIAIVKKKHAQDTDALVIFRLETFREWFV